VTHLQRRALAITPLSAETVQSFYDGTRSGTAEQCLKSLCESHERLRAELQGAEVLLKDAESYCPHCGSDCDLVGKRGSK